MCDAFRKSGIYLIKCNENNKSYVGSATYIKSRWARHRCDLRKGRHANKHLQSAWDRYGETSFEFSIIEECSTVELLTKEQFHIDNSNPEFNKLRLAGSSIGFKVSDETKEKLRRIFKGRTPSNKGVPRSEETKRRLKEAWVRKKERGYTATQETREKLSSIHKGKKKSDAYVKSRIGLKRSEEAIRKTALANTGKKRTTEVKERLSLIQKSIILKRQRDSAGRWI